MFKLGNVNENKIKSGLKGKKKLNVIERSLVRICQGTMSVGRPQW